jgi:proliferating cell nuclear antigen
MKILHVKTEHAGTIKILFEVLKELLPEGNLEFISPGKKTLLDDSDAESELESASDSESDSDSEIKKKIKNINLEDKVIENNSSESEFDTESESDKPSVKIKTKIKTKTKNKTKPNLKTNTKNKSTSSADIEKGGLKIMAVDNSKSVLLYVKLDADKFNKFVCKSKRLVLGVNFSFLYLLIKFVDKNDDLTFIVNDDEKDKLVLQYDRGGKESESSLTLMDLDDEEPVIPTTDFEVVITMQSNEFQRTCRELRTVGDCVQIKCLNNEISFSCKGDHSQSRTTYKDGENGVSIFYAEKDHTNQPRVVQGVYELKNLALFGKCSSLCEEVQIYMKGSNPECLLAIKYTVATLGKLFVCLSPIKVDDDSDAENDNFITYDGYYGDDINVKYK